jgi:hypothetical protein
MNRIRVFCGLLLVGCGPAMGGLGTGQEALADPAALIVGTWQQNGETTETFSADGTCTLRELGACTYTVDGDALSRVFDRGRGRLVVLFDRFFVNQDTLVISPYTPTSAVNGAIGTWGRISSVSSGSDRSVFFDSVVLHDDHTITIGQVVDDVGQPPTTGTFTTPTPTEIDATVQSPTLPTTNKVFQLVTPTVLSDNVQHRSK